MNGVLGGFRSWAQAPRREADWVWGLRCWRENRRLADKGVRTPRDCNTGCKLRRVGASVVGGPELLGCHRGSQPGAAYLCSRVRGLVLTGTPGASLQYRYAGWGFEGRDEKKGHRAVLPPSTRTLGKPALPGLFQGHFPRGQARTGRLRDNERHIGPRRRPPRACTAAPQPQEGRRTRLLPADARGLAGSAHLVPESPARASPSRSRTAVCFHLGRHPQGPLQPAFPARPPDMGPSPL